MANPYIGQIEAFPFGIVPTGWALCNGQLLSIPTNQNLFKLLGTTYGGDGVTNFGLPDLRGRVAISTSNFTDMGVRGGEERHTLTMAETPTHTHGVSAMVNGTGNGTNIPGGTVGIGSAYATSPGNPPVAFFSTAASAGTMAATTVTGGQPHENRMPYLAINYCINLNGRMPP